MSSLYLSVWINPTNKFTSCVRLILDKRQTYLASMIKLMISLFLLMSALASVSLLQFTYSQISYQELGCLQSTSYLDEVYIQLQYFQPEIIASVDEEALKNLRIKSHAIIFLSYFETYTPNFTISTWSNHILSNQYQSLWVSWAVNDVYKIDCEGVWRIYTALRKLSSKTGIFMNSWRWSSSQYYNIEYCQRLSQYPLFYDDIQFQQFQGWNNYTVKIDSILRQVCLLDELKILEMWE